MKEDTGMETSPLTKELYSIDWAVRFDEYRTHDQSSHADLHQLLAKIENIVESEIKDNRDDLNNIEVLSKKFSEAKAESAQWHRLSMLIHLKIVLAAIPKGLTSTATLSAIQIMEHMWKVLSIEQQQDTVAPTTKVSVKKPVQRSNPVPAKKSAPAKKPVPAAKKKVQPAKSSASKPVPAKNTANTSRSNKKQDNKTENVVIKKLAEEAGIDDSDQLATRCYEVASSLAEEYPEYTLTAIRVMTAEKLGVTRQFVENLDIKPARFKNG